MLLFPRSSAGSQVVVLSDQKLHLGKLNLWLVVNLFSAKQWRISPISAGSGSQNYQKRPTSRENNWPLFWGSVNYKIVKTSCGIKTTASEAFLYSLIYFLSLSFCSLFSVIFVFQTSNHSPELLSIPSFPIPSCLRSQWMSLQRHLREFKSLRRPPSRFHSASLSFTLTAVFLIATVPPDKAQVA